MYYFLYGNNREKAREKARAIADSLLAKKPDASYFRLTTENWSAAKFQEFIESQGLFVSKHIVFLDNLFELAEAKDLMLKSAKSLKESQNIFVHLEGEVSATNRKKIEKHADRVQEFSKVEKKEEKFNIFSMSDYLGARNKQKLWVKYIEAKASGLEDEAIHGTLFWSVKSLLLAKLTNSAKESGLNPFVFSKSKKASENFTLEELRATSQKLVDVYHDSRRGKIELGIGIEKFILEI